jgi:hypothetical protein
VVPETPTLDPAITKLLPALIGSVISLRWVQGTWYERLLMVTGGAALSYFGTPWVTNQMQMADAQGLVGFLIGLFGMAMIAPLYEAIRAADIKPAVADLWDRVLKRIGL